MEASVSCASEANWPVLALAWREANLMRRLYWKTVKNNRGAIDRETSANSQLNQNITTSIPASKQALVPKTVMPLLIMEPQRQALHMRKEIPADREDKVLGHLARRAREEGGQETGHDCNQ